MDLIILGSVITFFFCVIFMIWLFLNHHHKKSVLKNLRNTVNRGEKVIEFGSESTLTIKRNDSTPLYTYGVYDGISIKRNPHALELLLINTQDVNEDDLYPFYIPRDSEVFRNLTAFFEKEAKAL